MDKLRAIPDKKKVITIALVVADVFALCFVISALAASGQVRSEAAFRRHVECCVRAPGSQEAGKPFAPCAACMPRFPLLQPACPTHGGRAQHGVLAPLTHIRPRDSPSR